LHKAAEKGHNSVVRLLISRGASVTIKTHAGVQVFHLAAWLSRHNIDLLISKGIDIEAKDSQGRTVLN